VQLVRRRWRLDAGVAAAVAVSGLLLILGGMVAIHGQRWTPASESTARHAPGAKPGDPGTAGRSAAGAASGLLGGAELLLFVAAALVLAALLRRARVAEERLRITLRSVGDAVIATDAHGVVVFQNAVAEALTGWTQETARGRPLTEVFRVVDAETRVEVESPAARVLRDGAVVGLADHARLIARNGREVPIDESGAPIRSAEGKLLGMVLVFRDVSGREAAEAERRRIWQAEVARTEAKRANEARGAFLAVLSHELRSPLSAMLAWVGILERRSDDPVMRQRAIAVLQRSVHQQAQLINHLLDASRIIAGTLTLQRDPVDLAAAVAGTVEGLEPAARVKGVSLACDAGAGRLVVIGDKARFGQMVRNLVDDAIRFTPAGGRVDVALRRDGRHVELVVPDGCDGSASGRPDPLLDGFRQSATGGTHRGGGLGLGRAVVRHLVQAHGGTVSAESPGPGCGGVLVVRLPLADDAIPSMTEPPAAVLADCLAGVTVLLVDDDVDWRDAVALRLREAGALVATAGGVSEALTRLVAQPPAVLVSDIGMPDADGYELIRRVRRTLDSTVPAIAMTGFADPGSRERCLELGFDKFLCKPFAPDQLVQAITELLRDRGCG
jgi:PAS domain S-box-containing protein